MPLTPAHDDGASNEQSADEVHHDYRRRSTLEMSLTSSQRGKKHPHPHGSSEGHQQSWAETDWEELVKIWTREIMTAGADQMSSLSSEEFRENCDASFDDHRVNADGRMRELGRRRRTRRHARRLQGNSFREKSTRGEKRQAVLRSKTEGGRASAKQMLVG
jgi:hypothetical protein